MVSAWVEAALPDPVPLHQRGGGGVPPFPPRLLRANRPGSQELFLNLEMLNRRDPSLFLGVQFVHCSKMALQPLLWVSRRGSKAPVLGKREKNEPERGEISDAFPPPLIICAAGVGRAGATGAYKDLCAGKGIRLQAPSEWGETRAGTVRAAWRFREVQRPKGLVLGSPGHPGRGLWTPVARCFEAAKVCQKRES